LTKLDLAILALSWHGVSSIFVRIEDFEFSVLRLTFHIRQLTSLSTRTSLPESKSPNLATKATVYIKDSSSANPDLLIRYHCLPIHSMFYFHINLALHFLYNQPLYSSFQDSFSILPQLRTISRLSKPLKPVKPCLKSNPFLKSPSFYPC
jgi:hypothetical protein